MIPLFPMRGGPMLCGVGKGTHNFFSRISSNPSILSPLIPPHEKHPLLPETHTDTPGFCSVNLPITPGPAPTLRALCFLWSVQLITTRSGHRFYIMVSRRPMGRWEWYQMRTGLALGYKMFYSVGKKVLGRMNKAFRFSRSGATI